MAESGKRTAKHKYEDEHRTFLSEWEDLYFIVERNGKPFCLTCQTSLCRFKASSLERHFTSLHPTVAREFPKDSELRKHKELLSSAGFQEAMQESCKDVQVADWQLEWVLRYSIIVKSRGIIKAKGYLVHARKSTK